MKTIPVGTHLLILPIEEEKTSSIILDVKTQDKLQPLVTGVVKAKGRGTREKPMDEFTCSGKEIVMYPRHAGVEVVEAGVTYRIIEYDDIEAVL